MILTHIIVLVLILWKIKLRKTDNGLEYLSIEQTKSIQGIFTILVILSHFSTYIDLENSNILNSSFVAVNNRIGQLMVTMFLFYSGYGIMRKIQNNREEYMNGFIKNRFLPIYIKFAASIFLYLILQITLGKLSNFSVSDVIFSFVAWTNLGNSNWFMFVTFAMYMLTFVTFKYTFKNKTRSSLVLFTLFTVAYVLIFSLIVKKGVWWYNTILCFPLGMWYSFYAIEIDGLIKKNFFKVLAVSIVFCAFFYMLQDKLPLGYGYCALAIAFALIIVLITVKFKIGNPILSFFGRHIFSIYILQRLFYILFSSLSDRLLLYFIISVASTIVFAVFFDYCFDAVFKKIKIVK